MNSSFTQLLMAVILVLVFSDGAAAQSNRALQRRIDVEADGESLSVVLERVARTTKARIEFADEALAESAKDTSMSLHLRKVTLQTALNILTHVSDLDDGPPVWSSNRTRIQISSPPEVDPLVTGNFDLRGLAPVLGDPDEFRMVLMETTYGYWSAFNDDEGGGAIVSLTPATMQVVQYQDTLLEIDDLLAQLKLAVAGRPIRRAADGGPVTVKLQKTMSKPAKLSASEMKLVDLIREVMTECSASWWIDHPALDVKDIDIDAMITVPEGEHSWLEVLNTVLAEQGLGLHPEFDCIRVTTADNLDSEEITRVYDARRLPGGSSTAVIAGLLQQEELGPWVDSDGTGGIARSIGPLVIVRHSINKQARIAELLSGR